MNIKFEPIGIVRTEEKNIPRHWTVSDAEGVIVIDDKYADVIHLQNTLLFIDNLKKVIPESFEMKFIEDSMIVADPFKQDFIFLYDKSGEYPKIDLIVAKYKWELEGIQGAKPLEDIPFPVLPKPNLIAMKLKTGGLKDDHDIVKLHDLPSEENKIKTHELAKLIHKDNKLARLLKPKKVQNEREDKNQLL